jgi:CHAT domain-containing protein
MIEKLEMVLPKISPRSIIEQKDYYFNRTITQEAKELKVKLDNAHDEYNRIFAGNSNDTVLLSEKAEPIQSLTDQLKKIHPHYMELKDYQSIKLNDICSLLNDDDIFFQYIVTPICITNIIVTSSNVRIIPTLLDISNTDIIQTGIEFSNLVQDYIAVQAKDTSIENVSEEISVQVAATLFDYIAKNKVKRIYCMPDFRLGMFPLAAVNIESTFLIDIVDSIINIIDYRVLQKDRKKSIIMKVSNRIFGNTNDSELVKIDRWLRKKCSDSLFVIENNSDEFDELDSASIKDGVNTIVIYGHGASDPMSSVIDGAKGLEGKKKIIDFGEIVEKVKALDNLFLISCSGGSPAYNNVENSTGTWASIFEMFSGNILSCKWDVPTNQTIELITEIFTQAIDNCLSIDEALIIAQRKLKDNKNNLNAWAGIEYWIN